MGCLGGLLGPLDGPKTAQKAPRQPKRRPRQPRRRPRQPKRCARRPKRRPRQPKRRPRGAQEAPKTAPRPPQRAPKRPPQDPPNTTSECDPSKSLKSFKNKWRFNIFGAQDPSPHRPVNRPTFQHPGQKEKKQKEELTLGNTGTSIGLRPLSVNQPFSAIWPQCLPPAASRTLNKLTKKAGFRPPTPKQPRNNAGFRPRAPE